jgi:hypothetical protein
MIVLVKTYAVINNYAQCKTVKNKDEANEILISLDRTLEDKVFLEESGSKQIHAVKINGEWHIYETEIF